jgi:mannose-6-phosphate isomerase-like protein (cupin superfamily)
MSPEVAVITVEDKLQLFSELWSPKIIAELNDSYVKLAKFQGEYVWHAHDHEDEMFLVVSGQLKIELRGNTLTLNPGELVVIPKGVEHRPVAINEVAVILIEPKTTISTGNAVDADNKQSTQGEWL